MAKNDNITVCRIFIGISSNDFAFSKPAVLVPFTRGSNGRKLCFKRADSRKYSIDFAGGCYFGELTFYDYWQDLKIVVIQLIILLAVVTLIVLAIRNLSRKSKGMDKSTTNILIAVVIMLGLWFALGILGINAVYFVPRFIEWTTKFILPWVVLYWLVKLIKVLERK